MIKKIDYHRGDLYIAESEVYDSYGMVAKIDGSRLLFNVDRRISSSYMDLIYKFVDEAVLNGYER